MSGYFDGYFGGEKRNPGDPDYSSNLLGRLNRETDDMRDMQRRNAAQATNYPVLGGSYSNSPLLANTTKPKIQYKTKDKLLLIFGTLMIVFGILACIIGYALM